MKKKSSYAVAGNIKQLALPFAEKASGGCISTDDCQSAFPAAGYRNGATANNRGSNGYYWSGTANGADNAYNLNFNTGNANWNNNNRYNGFGVCSVSELADTAGLSLCLKPFRLTREQLLLDLYRAYKRARRHKRNTTSQIRFEMHLERELVTLRDELYNRTYRPGQSICFIIREPKVREIFAAGFRDRVVHHLYYDYTATLLERTFIHDSYSCRKGKGTLFGIRRLEHHIRSASNNYSRTAYVLKLDIRGYFMAIHRPTLLSVCLDSLHRSAFRSSDVPGKCWIEKTDYDFVEWLTRLIVLHDPVADCRFKGRRNEWRRLPSEKSLFKAASQCGLPIGNLTSQLFSNVYMNMFDQYMKRMLGCHHYGRYVDDAFVADVSKYRLRRLIPQAGDFLAAALHLALHPRKCVLCRADYGLDFLGAYLKPHRIYLRNSTLKRVGVHLQETRRMVSCPKQKRQRVNSLLGLMGHYATYRIRKRLLQPESAEWAWVGCFDRNLLKLCQKKT